MQIRNGLILVSALCVVLGVVLMSHAQRPSARAQRQPLESPSPRVQTVAQTVSPWSERVPPRISVPTIMPAQLSIDSIHVKTEITNGIAQSNVEQIWRNDSDRPQEGSYLFSVPEGATLSDFALYDGDKKLSARLLDPTEARNTYEGIVRRLKDPALLRYVGHSAYEVRLFPVPPHGTRRVTLRYTEVLRYEGPDTRRYVCPIGAGEMAGENGGNTRPRSISILVSLQDDLPITNIYSPTHDISVHRQGDHKATLSWEAQDAHVSDEFALYYTRTHHDPIGLAMLTYNVSMPPPSDRPHILDDGQRGSGTFMVMASPKTDLLDTQIMPKRVVLVLDRSGSMSGPKIEQAKGALSYVLKNLRPSDLFNVLTFSDANDILAPDQMLSANADNIKRGLAFVRDISAEGGTDIDDALSAALHLIPERGGEDSHQNMVIFLTDGLPTVGETNTSHIIEHARNLAKARGARLFDFGVGYDVDVPFLDRLAEQNHGDADYVRPEEDIEAKVSHFYRKVASPVLADVHLEIEGLETSDVLPNPSDLPDLFTGSQLMVLGRYTGSGKITVRLSGTVNGKPAVYTLPVTVPAVADQADFLPRLWATRKVGYLLDAIRLQGTDPNYSGQTGSSELINEVIRISKEYGIITPYTSFLVTEDGDRQPPPVFLPMAKESAGAAATTDSQAFRALKSAAAPAAPSINQLVGGGAQRTEPVIKTAGSKTFFLRSGIWTDSRFDPGHHGAVTTVLAFSEAHDALMRALPILGAYSSLGENVLIVLDNGQILKISATEGVKTLNIEAVRALVR